jgi:hypothetical protein
MSRFSPATLALIRDVRHARAKFEQAFLRIGPRQTAAIARLMSSLDAARVARLALGVH